MKPVCVRVRARWPLHSARRPATAALTLRSRPDYTSISSGKAYWKNGTQGAVDPSNSASSTSNGSVPSFLQLYSLKFRKSFGFGVEVTGIVGFMPKTSIISGGTDVRWSLLEGFRTGLGGILPDFSIGAGVRTVTGTPQFNYTVAGLDARLVNRCRSKNASVTPYIGTNPVDFADSGLTI